MITDEVEILEEFSRKIIKAVELENCEIKWKRGDESFPGISTAMLQLILDKIIEISKQTK